MARKSTSQTDQLAEMLRARGLRKKVADQIAGAVGRAPKRTPPKAVQTMIGDLGSVVRDLEQRVTGGGGQKDPKRVAAGKKAAATRKRASSKRSASAKKGAQTRAKSTTRSASRTSASRPKAKAKAKR